MTDYQSRFFKNLKKIFRDIESSSPDVTLHCIKDGTHLKCHRIILYTSSDYFKNVFSWSTSDIVEVHNDITGDILRIILNYIYSGEISITLDNASDVLCAANYFTLTEIVEDCIKFILENLEINSSIEMFQFSYQLDLSKLINGCVSFIANNFSYITKDVELKQKLFLLPIDLMVKLLKSNDLVIRDPETELLTRPAEREKHILELIFSYTENMTDRSNAITTLCNCIKWPLLKIFGEEEFIFSKFAPCLDKEDKKLKLEEHLQIKHSEWFLLPENCIPTEEDKSIYSTRAFSCSELIPLPAMADGDEVLRSIAGGSRATSEPKPFSIIAKDFEHLVKMDIVLRLWDGRTVVGGIGVYFSSGNKTVYEHVGTLRENGTGVNTIVLEKNEHIISAHGNSGWLIDCVVFETSKTKKYGPYGGDGGGTRNFMHVITKYHEEGGLYEDYSGKWYASVAPGPHKQVPLNSVLVGITGKEVKTGNELAIIHLKFIFREMLPGSQFLINNEKKSEIFLHDAYFKPMVLDPYNRRSSEDSYSDLDDYGGYGDHSYSDEYDEYQNEFLYNHSYNEDDYS